MSSPPADPSRPPLPHLSGRFRPAWPVVGFVVLLGVLFTLAYVVGGLTGPVSPGMRPTDGEERTEPAEPGDMGGMHGMGALTTGAAGRGGR
ncbi:hypothetical protein ACWY4P_01325 [Streptomyces sp. LZ34]